MDCPICKLPVIEQPTLDASIRQVWHCGKVFYIKAGEILNPPQVKTSKQQEKEILGGREIR